MLYSADQCSSEYIRRAEPWLLNADKYLLHVLQQYRISERILNLIPELYSDYECQVTHKGNLTEAFKMHIGVRQGCTYFVSDTISHTDGW